MHLVKFLVAAAVATTPAWAQKTDLEKRIDRLEAEVQRLRADVKKEQRSGRTAPSVRTSAPVAKPGPLPNGDPVEAAYMNAYGLWSQHKLEAAAPALLQVAKRYPHHRRASYARNLAGRAYLEAGKPATAANVFLDNQQLDPDGERAPDSLFYLGAALVKLNKRKEACQVYGALETNYARTMRAAIRQKLQPAKADALCGASVAPARKAAPRQARI